MFLVPNEHIGPAYCQHAKSLYLLFPMEYNLTWCCCLGAETQE